MTVYNEIASVY